MSLQKARELLRVERHIFLCDWKVLPQRFVLSSSFLGIAFHPFLPEFDKAGTPVTATVNAISSINAVFGTVKFTCKGGAKTAAIEEDANG
jgi:hypothetical protein